MATKFKGVGRNKINNVVKKNMSKAIFNNKMLHRIFFILASTIFSENFYSCLVNKNNLH